MRCPKCGKDVSVLWAYKDVVEDRKKHRIFAPLPYWGYPELCILCLQEIGNSNEHTKNC